MKILYGVQATGNGHITRARAMCKHFKAAGISVDFLFSGRDRADFFDMDKFGDWQCYRGLTFIHEAGDLKIFRTIQHNSIRQFWRDVKSLNLDDYDVMLTDFEPIVAWAAKRAGKTCIGVGHQYAFDFSVPKRGASLMPRLIMQNFAPVSMGLGLHWHHFNQAILPPIAETHATQELSDPNKVVVYLGFESAQEVIALLEPFDDHLFVFYGPFAQYESRGHIQLKPLSREGFKQDLATAGGVICNAGFELSSEAIQLGKKLLIKPLNGQMEQLSNAKALEDLGLGMSMDTLDPLQIRRWLDNWNSKQVIYPDVAEAIVNWISQSKWKVEGSRDQLIEELWAKTQAPNVASFRDYPKPVQGQEFKPSNAVV